MTRQNSRASIIPTSCRDSPLLATVPYAIARLVLRLPSHPLDQAAFPYWAADYWATLGTSGLFTAGTAVLLVLWARELGCSARKACLIGLAYGLATPAYVYATLAYGHQAVRICPVRVVFPPVEKETPARLIPSVPRRLPGGLRGRDRASGRAGVGDPGFLPAGPVPARRPAPRCPGALRGRGARPDPDPADLQPARLRIALGHGLFSSRDTAVRRRPQRRQSPRPESSPIGSGKSSLALLWGRYRGLTFYAPILLLTVPGWVVLIVRRHWDLAVVTFSVVIAVVLVNLFYPEWTGGWSTGPRLLVPLITVRDAARGRPPGGRFTLGTTWPRSSRLSSHWPAEH